MKILISYNLQLVLHTCQALRLIQQNPAAKFFVVMFHVSQEKPRRMRLVFLLLSSQEAPLRSHWKASREKCYNCFCGSAVAFSVLESFVLLISLQSASELPPPPKPSIYLFKLRLQVQMLLAFHHSFELWIVWGRRKKRESLIAKYRHKQDKQDILPLKKVRLHEKCKVFCQKLIHFLCYTLCKLSIPN